MLADLKGIARIRLTEERPDCAGGSWVLQMAELYASRIKTRSY